MKIFEGFTTSPTTISITSSSSPIVSVGILLGLNATEELSIMDISGNFALEDFFKLAKDKVSSEAVLVDKLHVRDTLGTAVVIVEDGEEAFT